MPTAPLRNVPEYSVSELSSALKKVVEGTFDHVRVRGEISGFKKAPSGHSYMSLKDEDAVIRAVSWKGVRLSITPEDGMEVVITGKLSTYAGRSEYQLLIESMELAGQGAILKMLEERKKKLAAEGLFDEARKKPLPFLPGIIGVVTSPTGAVIHDIITTLERRFPRRVILAPVKVQGEGAAQEIAEAITRFSQMKEGRPDVLIVARGGGSLEDLLPFSEEIVVRAVAASLIPVISSVGHEVDTMLIDYAADKRAATPTAAAEMAVPVRQDLKNYVQKEEMRLSSGMGKFLRHLQQEVAGLARGILSPKSIVLNMAQRLDNATERLEQSLRFFLSHRQQRLPEIRPPYALLERLEHPLQAMARMLPLYRDKIVERAGNRLESSTRLLESYSYKNVLARGFALIKDGKGAAVASVKNLKAGERIGIVLQDGELPAEIMGAGKKTSPQGTLL